MASSGLNIRQLILVPAIITLGVTILRLVGELNNWAPVLFSREAGGGGAIVGISWLPILFGVYFGLKLANAGHGPTSGWKSAGFSLLAVVVVAVVFLGASALSGGSPLASLAGGAVGSLLALFVLSKGWSEMFKTLLAYAFAARIPVVLVMLVAILGDWGTHYDVLPPEAPEMAPFVKWLVIGVVPQMTFWIAFTVLVGNLFGSVAVALAGKTGRSTKQATQTA
jgi:hypothetical protein